MTSRVKSGLEKGGGSSARFKVWGLGVWLGFRGVRRAQTACHGSSTFVTGQRCYRCFSHCGAAVGAMLPSLGPGASFFFRDTSDFFCKHRLLGDTKKFFFTK